MAGKVVKLEIGTVYKKSANGSYYFRYQINGQRKAVSLKTKNQKEAISKAQELIPIVKATTSDVISAHVKQARGLATSTKSLPLIYNLTLASKKSNTFLIKYQKFPNTLKLDV